MTKVYRSIRYGVVSGVLALGLVGCAAERPQSTVSRNLDSGVTASNGGGMAPSNFGNFSTPASPPPRTTP